VKTVEVLGGEGEDFGVAVDEVREVWEVVRAGF
jgi:hypothetical protein